jgi:hypothetical protein
MEGSSKEEAIPQWPRKFCELDVSGISENTTSSSPLIEMIDQINQNTSNKNALFASKGYGYLPMKLTNTSDLNTTFSCKYLGGTPRLFNIGI